ncbi:MAG: DNA (cytosine-5-)-methyltransferase [Armatimonadetes bacterium]|nr:DNA (cytosine-5-)-methyltransferase [Armatimonadota bacterium]MDE2205730.1 DNA (cytosine-5-)-methyltransferase [Armatimonadota bacterium]
MTDVADIREDLSSAQAHLSRLHSVVSLFSGCGGLDLGFTGGFQFLGREYDALPFEIKWANDVNPNACNTYRRNLADHIVCGDVWESMSSMPERADVVIGGFPCQDISINGKRAGVAGVRSGLYRAMVEAVTRLKPQVFVAENVKGLLLKYNADSLKAIISAFEDIGYNVSYGLYLAAEYGVPQMRERVFIVGTLPAVRPFSKPAPLMFKEAWVTSQDAIGDLIGMEESEAINHIWSKAALSPDQGNRRIKADRPADTIRAECHGNIQFHYSLPRRISMREAARFQSFPDEFIFESRLRETERQVGNAVPPVLGWHIARSVADCLK